MDSVRFHHCADVKNWCEQKNIIIKYLPRTVHTLMISKIIRPLVSTNAMIKNNIGKVITNVNNDPDRLYNFQKMRDYITLAKTT